MRGDLLRVSHAHDWFLSVLVISPNESSSWTKHSDGDDEGISRMEARAHAAPTSSKDGQEDENLVNSNDVSPLSASVLEAPLS